MFLNADFRPGPAMALPGLSRSTDDLFYSDPSLRRGGSEACVGSVTHSGAARPWHCDHIGPHEPCAAIANLQE